MTNKEAFYIVLKMAKERDMTGYDIMYDGQEAEVKREREALETVCHLAAQTLWPRQTIQQGHRNGGLDYES